MTTRSSTSGSARWSGPISTDPAAYVRQILPLGFESIRAVLLADARRQGLAATCAANCARRSAIADVIISYHRHVRQSARRRRHRPRDARRHGKRSSTTRICSAPIRSAGFTGRVRGKPLTDSLPRFHEGVGPACQARRGQGRQDRLRELRDGRQLGDRRLEHRAQSRCLGADVQRAAERQSRPRMGAVPPARLPDRSDPADPQMGAEDSSTSTARTRRCAGMSSASTASSASTPFVQMRTPGFRRQRLDARDQRASARRLSRRDRHRRLARPGLPRRAGNDRPGARARVISSSAVADQPTCPPRPERPASAGTGMPAVCRRCWSPPGQKGGSQ